MKSEVRIFTGDMSNDIHSHGEVSKKIIDKEANWSGSALFVIKYVNFYQKPGSSNLIGWKLEMGVAS